MPRVTLLPYCILVSICCSGLLWTFVSAASEQYGNNPQHEFGNTLGGEAAPLIPFWTLEGDAFARSEFVRVVPDRQSKRGGIWNTEPNRFRNWEAIFKFRIHGVSRLGADGMVFWYTQEHSLSGRDNNFFGFTDTFTGLGLAIDTYDNDNTGKHPLIVAIINDGTKKYSHAHDDNDKDEDEKEEERMEVGNCHVAVRNSPPWYIKVSYQDRQLVVQTSGDSQEWNPCLIASNIDLPTGYHFGFTAATGELADNHDVYGFAVKNLDNGAINIDNKRVYASYDRYTVTDYLSKIAFQVNALANQVPENAGEAGNGVRRPPISGEASSSTLTALNNNILAIQGTINELTRDIAGISSSIRDGQAAGQGGAVPGDAAGNSEIQNKLNALERKLDSTQVILNNIEMNIARQVSGGNNNNNPPPTPTTIRQQRDKNDGNIPGFPVSKSWLPSIGTIIGGFVAIVVVLVVVCVVAVFILRARAERRKKFW